MPACGAAIDLGLAAASRTYPEMRKRGIRVVIGGDYGFARTPQGDNARDIEHFVRHLGYSPSEALVCATRYGAELMGHGRRGGAGARRVTSPICCWSMAIRWRMWVCCSSKERLVAILKGGETCRLDRDALDGEPCRQPNDAFRQLTMRSRPSQYGWRTWRRSTLPTDDRGSSLTNLTVFGAL